MEFHPDILKYIAQYITNDTDRYYFMMTSKSMLKLNLTFNEEYEYDKIMMSPLYHQFTNIQIGETLKCMNKYFMGQYLLTLPKNVQRLSIGYFDGLIKKSMIPTTVTHLIFDPNIYNFAMRCIPPSVKYLTIACSYINFIIPMSVTHIILNNYNDHFHDHIPSSVTDLEIIGYFLPINNKIPSSVTNVKISCTWNDKIFKCMTDSVTHLSLSYTTDDDFTVPSSITHLIFTDGFNVRIINKLPSFITHLTFENIFNKAIDNGIIPSSVTHLTFGHYFNTVIQKSIPSSVTHLKFGEKFNQSIIHTIPESVIYLTFGKKFNRSLLYLPSSITHLTLGKLFKQKLLIPPSVKYLYLNRNYKGNIPSNVNVYYDD